MPLLDVPGVSELEVPVITCQLHGSHPWAGHILCSECKQMWQVNHCRAPRFATPRCPCGALLFPEGNVMEGGQKYAGRLVCGGCYRFWAEVTVS